MAKRQVYMDHNATTPLHPEVKKVMTKALEDFGNPSSLHSFGRHARKLVEDARATVASFIGASPDEIIFMGSGSEANNTVLSMFSCPSGQCLYRQKAKTEIITSNIEHPCILETSRCLQDRGTCVSCLGVDKYGKVDLEKLKNIITEKTGLVSVMMANNEIGTIQDIKTIADIVHKRGALFHTDAVQAVGKIPVDVNELGVDFLTISAHKIYGPKGIGALYVKKGIPFCSLIRGGHQEQGRRAGTENTLGIVGLGKAIEMRKKEMNQEKTRLLKLKAVLRKGIEENISEISFNGHPADCLAGTLNVSFDGAEGEAILLYLDLEGIAVSTGSACASGSLDPSHVLLAIGLTAESAHGSIRISMGRDNTLEDVNYVIDKLSSVIKRIRGMSTAYTKKVRKQ
ncbi:MAG TPA: cysteine desulfurase family protein [Candidatus Omnitrophota bacterium]|nr:cysteine desulfurase family protein [Candidatus Omnitrophota bacterium]